jgi:hypothetical protein
VFAVRRGDIKKRADVVYAADLDLIQSRYANPLYDLVPLGTLTKVVQYGTSKRASSEPVGVAVLRIPNLQVEGWDLNDLKYLVLTTEELSTYRLEKGDIRRPLSRSSLLHFSIAFGAAARSSTSVDRF